MKQRKNSGCSVTLLRWFFIFWLKVYKLTLSRFIGAYCIHKPTCSVYAMEAYREFGSVLGTWLTAKRLLKCGPWAKGRFDPVPHKFGGNIKWSF